VQTPAGLDVPDEDLLVRAAADEDLLAGYPGAEDDLDEVGVAAEFAAGLGGLNVPGPDVLVPAAGEDGLVGGAADGDARYGSLGAAVGGFCRARLVVGMKRLG
jgi:hypothetical protein